MSKALAESILRLKGDSSENNKMEFVSKLISDKFFVPVVVEADRQTHNITKMGYYSIAAENGSFLLVFTSVEAIGAWRKDVQFLELGYNDICGIVNVEGAEYAGVLIDHGGNNSMALKKDFLDKVKSHIKVKK
ncbi:MAG: SseB family protein [Clostridia bacterium]|nr:SseB family protein [Clostridia bacterium]